MQKKTWIALGVLLGGACLSHRASAKTIYVAGTGADANDGTAPSRSLRTLAAAAAKTAPGDVVEVDDGVYDAFTISISGTDAAWIRYLAKSGAKPKIAFSGWNGIFIESAHHIEIRGFEVAGPMAARTLEACTADADAATPDPLCNGNGISLDGRKVSAKPHHVIIAGNDVHDCPGGGISAIEADYVTVEENFVHGNALHTRYGASGISFLNAWSSDAVTDVKMIVRRNRVFGNKTLVKWVQIQKLSDGNGIIVDSSKNDTTSPLIPPYAGRTLVENNLSVGNGGSGIHAYKSAHVDIVHNTTFENGQVVGYAEIFSNASDDVRIVNNVMIGRPTGDVNTKDAASTATYDYNVYFAGKVNSQGAHDLVADPKVIAASLDPLVADFRLADGSPAIDTATTSLTSPVDLTGAARPAGAGPDRGAYEKGAVTGVQDAGADADAATSAASDASAEGGEPGTPAASDASTASSSDAGGDDGATPGGAQGTSSGCACGTVRADAGDSAIALGGLVALLALSRRRAARR